MASVISGGMKGAWEGESGDRIGMRVSFGGEVPCGEQVGCAKQNPCEDEEALISRPRKAGRDHGLSIARQLSMVFGVVTPAASDIVGLVTGLAGMNMARMKIRVSMGASFQ